MTLLSKTDSTLSQFLSSGTRRNQGVLAGPDEKATTALFQEISDPRLDRFFGLADGFNISDVHNSEKLAR
jgi:hypothetical protein